MHSLPHLPHAQCVPGISSQPALRDIPCSALSKPLSSFCPSPLLPGPLQDLTTASRLHPPPAASGRSPFLKYPHLLKNTHGSALPSASTPSLQVTLPASSPFPLSDHVRVLLSGALFHKHTRPFPARCLAHAVPSVCVPFLALSTQGTPNSSFQAQPTCPAKTPQLSPVESLCPHSCTMAPAAGPWSVGHWLPL